MADDWGLAARPYVPPAINPLETLQGIEKYRILQNQNRISGLEAHQKQIDTNNLENFGNTGNPQSMRGSSPEAYQTTLSSKTTDENLKKDTISRTAAYIQGEKDERIKKELWKTYGNDWVKKGWIPAEVWDKHKDEPNDQVLGNLARGNISVPEYRQTSGEAEGAAARARAPYDFRETDPNRPVRAPAVQPGGPLANGQGPINVLTSPDPYGAGDQPPRSKNLTDTNAAIVPTPVPTSREAPPGSPAAAPGKNATATEDKNPYAKEVPDYQVGEAMPTGKGIVQAGKDPQFVQARTEGLKKYNEEYAPMATAASKSESSLGTMRTKLESGDATTSKLADVQNSAAGFLNAMGVPKEAIKGITGVDLSNQEVINKETVRMGMNYAKETNGMRQAAQTIQVELAANPSMLTSKDGNLKVIKIMEAGAKYDKEMVKAADAYMKKNNHLTGFETWWANTHPAAQFISKEAPWQPPSDISKMQNGITYEWKDGDRRFKGTYNAENGHMEPVN